MIIHDQPLVTIFGNHCFMIMSRMLIMIDQYLVGGIPTLLKNMSSSVGMMTFPTEWKNNPNVPNHHFDSHFDSRVTLMPNVTRLG